MNKVILMGRLTRDPDVRYTNTDDPMAIARYSLAVDRRVKKENEQSADFISCVAFKKAAEFAEKYFQKGTRILISGRIQTGSYTDRDGKKIYTTDVIVEEQEFAQTKKEQEQTGSSQNMYHDDGFMQIPDGVDDEGLPFN